MAALRVRRIDESDLDSVLAEDFEFEGEIRFEKPLLVKGHVSGKVASESDLFVNEDAVVEADVDARRVSVKGSISGDVVAGERLELFVTARIDGNITTPDLIVQSGSRLNGRVTMADAGQDLVSPASGAPQSSSEAIQEGDNDRSEQGEEG